MIRQLFKNTNFISGSFLVLVIIVVSVVNTHFFQQDIDEISQSDYLLIKATPPSLKHPFGTSAGGIDMFDLILRGTIPTLKMALFVAFGRMGISLMLGLIYGMRYKRLKWMEFFIEGFNFVPVTLLSFLLLYGLNNIDFEYFMDRPDFRWYFIVYTLIAVGIPPLIQLIGKETNLAYQNEFIESSKVLGGGLFHILFNHVMPIVRGKFVLIFNNQLISVLTLMMHLSILGFFIPGWSAFIGSNYFELMISPWIIFFPVLLFTLLIVSLKLVTDGIRIALDGEYLRRRSTNIDASYKTKRVDGKTVST